MTKESLSQLYRPNHDETARQAFVGSLKGFVNGALEAELAERQQAIAGNAHGSELREDALFKLWASSVYTSQDLMWESVGDTIDRLHPAYLERWSELAASDQTHGSLELNPDLEIPDPIGSREIHRQPGGYFHNATKDDLTAPLVYFSSVELYMAAKQMGTGAASGSPVMWPLIFANAQKKIPALAPKSVLDLGCGPGMETLGARASFPDARICGVDLSAPFLKFAHLFAEDQEQEIHFRQANAAQTGFDNGEFDLIYSHILFHETSQEILPQIMREACRLLAPGGLFINADVPYQTSQLPPAKRATNAWQVEFNGEPFWKGFADTDVEKAMIDAGFEPDECFAEYVPLGAGRYFIFGAVREED